MVGVSDIPCVGKAVERISDATVEAVFRGLHYMCCYKDLLNILNSEIDKLSIHEERMSRKAVAERADGKTVEAHVFKWQKDVQEIQESAKELSEKSKNRPSWRCIQCLSLPKPISRFRLGREAVKKAKRVTELNDSGKEFLASNIAYLPAVENIPKSDDEFQNFQSRKDAYGKIWEMLVAEGSSLVLGIYGIPGVGKSRMMEQIWNEAKGKGIFDEVVRADVGSGKLDEIKLQNQIARCLNCHLESQDNVKHRASQLKSSLQNKGKILIILDDVWSVIPFDIIGISLGDGSTLKGCKVLLTSREKVVCLRNYCEHPVKITTLTVDEAWDLFRYTVGSLQMNCLQDESLAHEVCDRCGGLPLLIRAVGKALQFTSHSSWKDALHQLQKGTFENITDIDSQVFACIKLSIDKLPDDAKLCLFLCSLFPEDAGIHIKRLILLATGSHLVLDESRIRAMVDFLITSLLLDCQENLIIKVHDIIRDVGRSIAEKDPHYAFLNVRCGSRMPDIADRGTQKLLRLDLESDDVQFPDDLVCPELHTLWLESNYHTLQVSGGLFSIFINLRFLALQGVFFLKEQQFSFQPLSKLRTLFLDVCDMTNIDQAVSFFPERLETLCIWDCDLPRPLNLPNLKYLQKLEIVCGFPQQVHMAPKAISRLSSLEKLHIPTGIHISEDAISSSVPISEELSKLTRLTSLQIFFWDFEPLQDTNIIPNLLEFNIRVGLQHDNLSHRASRVSSKRLIQLYGYQSKGLECLTERAEELTLSYSNVKVNSICNSNREAFADLRKLYINQCDTIGHLASISQDKIQHIRQSRTSFSKLVILEIRDCSALKYLFCNSVARCLVQLQELCMDNCPSMEAIVMNEGTSDGELIKFSKLKSLKLSNMPKLTSFYAEKKDFSSAEVMDYSAIPSFQFQPLFDRMVVFPSLEELHIDSLEDTSDIWEKHYYNGDVSFCQLKRLLVSNCNKLEIVIPLAMLHRLQNLEYLSIYCCKSLISEVGTYDRNTAVCPLVALRDIDLVELPCLTKTGLNSWEHSEVMTLYPNLETIKIRDCNILKNVFLPSTVRYLMHLREIWVDSCEMMRNVLVSNEHGITVDGIVFPELTVLHLTGLPNLTSFWYYQGGEASTYKVQFPNMLDVKLSCGKINLEATEMGRDGSTCQLMSLNISCDDEIQLPCQWQLRLYNLERLILRHTWWQELTSPCFQRLIVLEVHELGCSTLFTFSVFRSLQQLQTLEISNCASLKEIIEDVRSDEPSAVDKKTITLFKLNSIVLKDLPNLKSFVHSTNYECTMPALEKVEVDNCGLTTLFTCSVIKNLQHLKKLRVQNCRSMEGIVEDVKGDASHTMDKIITFFQLSEVILIELPNLRSFFHSANYECQMPALLYVEVDNCGLSNLFTWSIFRNLRKIENLQVRSCKLLKGVVEDARGNETSSTEDTIIILFRLSSVVLRDLPKLKCFLYGANYECHVPALKGMDVHNCGLSTLFTCSAFRSLQELEFLRIMNCRLLEGIVEDARGDETSDTYDRIIICFRLSSVTLGYLPSLKSFFHSAKYECHMPAIEVVKINNCGLSSIFTCSVFRNLQQIKFLEVWDCRFLEAIVQDTRGDKTSNTNGNIITLFRLSSVALRNLPNLKCFSSTSNYAFSMPRLSTLRLLRCPQIETFTCLKTSTGLVSIHSQWNRNGKFPDLNEYIRQNCSRK